MMVTLNLAGLTDGVKSVRRIAMIPNIVSLPNSATNAKRKDILLGSVEQKVFNNPRRPQNQHNHLLKPNFIEQRENSETIFYACYSANEEKGDVWYLDSGCTNHMTDNHQFFHEINTSFETNVRMGNDTLVQAKENSTIAFHTKWV
jgi:DNA polymerase III delta prime subunit